SGRDPNRVEAVVGRGGEDAGDVRPVGVRGVGAGVVVVVVEVPATPVVDIAVAVVVDAVRAAAVAVRVETGLATIDVPLRGQVLLAEVYADVDVRDHGSLARCERPGAVGGDPAVEAPRG